MQQYNKILNYILLSLGLPLGGKSEPISCALKKHQFWKNGHWAIHHGLCVLSVFLCLIQFPSIWNSSIKFGESYQMLNLVVYHLHDPRLTQSANFRNVTKLISGLKESLPRGWHFIKFVSQHPLFMPRAGTNTENMATSFPEPWLCDASAEAEINCTVSEAGWFWPMCSLVIPLFWNLTSRMHNFANSAWIRWENVIQIKVEIWTSSHQVSH